MSDNHAIDHMLQVFHDMVDVLDVMKSLDSDNGNYRNYLEQFIEEQCSIHPRTCADLYVRYDEIADILDRVKASKLYEKYESHDF